MTKVFKSNEVYLFGYHYPVLTDVNDSLGNQWAQKQVVGDYTKDSELYTSSYISSDHRGGVGIKDMVEEKDAARCWWSTLNLDFKGHLVLPPLVTDCGNPGTNDAAILVEYNNKLYAVFATDLRSWNDTTQWSDSIYTLTATPTSAVVHNNYLFLACGTDFERWDGASNCDSGANLTGSPVPSRYLLEWDGKLLNLDNNGRLRYSVDNGATWTNNAAGVLPAGYYTSLTLYRDSSGYALPYMGTKQGVYVLDFDAAKWTETGLSFPRHDYACMGMTAWRDGLYVPVGSGVYQFISSSSPTQITPMGPDRDYGLPREYRGNLIQILNEHNNLYALLDASSETPRDLYSAAPGWETVIYSNEGYSALLKFSGLGWSVVKMSGSGDAPATCALVANAYSSYRLWFAMGKKVYYIPLNINLQNPLEVSDYAFAASGEHIWPWFDADNSVIDKLALGVSVYAERTSADEYLLLYYGLDGDDNAWSLLTNSAFPDGKIDADGEAKFTFALDAGVNFKSIRFKAILYRGPDAAKSPDLKWLRLDYIKLTSPRWQYSFTIDCTRDYKHHTRGTLLNNLKAAAETKTLGDFVYKTIDGTSNTAKVRILSMKGSEKSGRVTEGIYQISLLAP